jgi:hypothetical protein
MSVDSDEETPQPLAIDVKHLNSEMVDIAVEDLYTESALSRLHDRGAPSCIQTYLMAQQLTTCPLSSLQQYGRSS